MSWQEVEICDLGKVVTGKTPPTKIRDYFDGNYCFVSPKDLDKDSRYITNTLTKISELAIQKFKNQILPENSIFFTALSYGFGKMGIASEICLTNQQINSIIVNPNKYDFIFIYYLLRYNTLMIRSYDSGIVTPIVPKSTFEKIKIKVPDSLETQERIADILSAYDDLIENNLKRINLLEQAAQNIYNEWFVNLRFPNHENTPVNKETGLPEGWERVLAKEYFDFKRGIEVGSKNYTTEESENTIPFLRVGSLGSRDKDVFTYVSLVKDKILNFSDVCVSMDGSIGLVGYGLVGAYSTGLRKVIQKLDKYGNGFIYCLLKSEDIQDTIRAYAKGSTILHASSSIEHLRFNNAPDEISNQFNSTVEPIYKQLLSLNKQNQKLKAARDILLPRLMNRTIDI